jgi:predicted RNase H-like HicB family nuclease
VNKEYTLIIERGEDGLLIGSILELPGCHTQGKTIEELLFNIREAIELYLEVEKPDVTTEFVGLQKIIL